MEELVVTETSLPLRIGVNTERRGSALWRTVWIYASWVSIFHARRDRIVDLGDTIFGGSNKTPVFAPRIAMQMR